MEVVVTTADWMAIYDRSSDKASVVVEERLAILAMLSSALEHQTELTAPSAQLMSRLDAEIAALPPQMSGVGVDEPFAQWMAIAALTEHCGALRLAQLMVDRVRELVDARGKSLIGEAARSGVERTAICWARRGRIARTNGQFDDAIACYEQAAANVRSRPWIDARPQAELGLATVAAIRGNIPEAERRANALLAHRPHIFAIYQVNAHQLLSFAKRKRGLFIDALLNAWAAFDLLGHEDFRRHELVGVMSEIALELGDLDAASHGFDAVLDTDVSSRIRVPTLAGAVDVCLRRMNATTAMSVSNRLESLLDELRVLITTTLSPNDRASALIALAEGAMALGQGAEAERWLSAAATTSADAKLFERQFRIDALRVRLNEIAIAMNTTIDPTPRFWTDSPPRATGRMKHRHHSLVRLACMSFDQGRR